MAAARAQRILHSEKDLSRPAHTPPLIVLSSGEPAGIGPDICAALAGESLDARLAVLGDADTFSARIEALGLGLRTARIDGLAETPVHRAGRLALLHIPLAEPARPGHLEPANSAAVVRMLETGAQACLERTADALVTAPVQKSVINQAGIRFQGHTEFLAALTGAPHPVMLLRSRRLSVALATTHLPLAEVPRAITRSSLIATLRVVDEDLRRRFGLAQPRIMVLGLNPHAGENGVLGTEENDTIAPAVAELADSGVAVFGPVSADSAFTPQSLENCDVVVAMYHDQGLPVLKAQDFGEIVNVTLGLPIIRTSVDHGTALSLAGSGRASHASLRAATELAIRLAAGDGA